MSLAHEFIELLENSIEINQQIVRVKNLEVFRKNVYKLAKISAFETGNRQGMARFLIRAAALNLGLAPASINALYMARGKGEVPFTFTVPAINLRMMAFDSASAVFRAALIMDTAAIIFEIARSEMNYSDQRPSEYTTSILAAAISEGYKGPIFIQGDHFQISAKKFANDPQAEIVALQALIRESIAGGFLNIDIDTSTLVDLKQTTIPAQQKLNIELSASLTAYIRSMEPKGISISVGGEIGEVGGHNSTEEELRAYLDGYKQELQRIAPNSVGLSKISIQTGTSHGGVVLPDGSIAKVDVDFDTMLRLSRVSRNDYGLGGAVQHGASTLPENDFGKFVEAEACEIHLATNFMNMYFDHLPKDLHKEIYAFLDQNYADERKPGMTDEQFYYKARKWAVGPYKRQSWELPENVKAVIVKAWEVQFTKLFHLLGLTGSRRFVEKFVKLPEIKPGLQDYVVDMVDKSDTSDLAD